MPLPRLGELWRNPNFHGLPPEERRRAIDMVVQDDPEFNALPPAEQTRAKAMVMVAPPQGIEAERPTWGERVIRKGGEALKSSQQLGPGLKNIATGHPIKGGLQTLQALGSIPQAAYGTTIGAATENAAGGGLGLSESTAQAVGQAAELATGLGIGGAASRGAVALPEVLEKHAPLFAQWARTILGIPGPASEMPLRVQRPTGGLSEPVEEVAQEVKAAVGAGPEFAPPSTAAQAATTGVPMPTVALAAPPAPTVPTRVAEAVEDLADSISAPRQVKPPPLEGIPGGKAPTGPPPGPLPKYAGSVNLERINTSDDVKRAIVEASERIPKAQPISLEEVESAAQKLGFSLEDAEGFARMTTKQRAMFVATRDVHTALEQAYLAAKEAFNANPTREAFQALKKAQANQLRGFQAAQTVASEAGRSLGSFRILSNANVSADRAKRVIDRLLLEISGKSGEMSDEITRRLAATDLSDPEQVGELVRYLSPQAAGIREKLFEWFNASILSGPLTHIVNNTSNLLQAVMLPVETAGAAAVEVGKAGLRRLAGKTPEPREVFFGEAVEQAFGMARGIEDGVRAFLKTAARGASDLGKVETRGPAIGGKLGKAIRAPLTLLGAEDDFWKAVVSRGEMNAAAYREAHKAGLRGRDAVARAAELVASPTDDMLARAEKTARTRTFQDPVGGIGELAYAFRRRIPLGEFVLPFVRTPVNVAKQGLQRTPLNFIRIAYLKSKGQLSGRELSEELGKTAIGSGISAAIAMKAAGGDISGGGPVDPEQRKALMATGWQPYSIHIGDKWYSYARLEPIATVIGTVADTVELTRQIPEGDFKNIASKTAAAIGKNLSSKTFLEGLSNFFETFHDPGNRLERLVGGFAGAAVPSAVAQVARAQDPSLREVRTILDSLRARIPGVREELPPKRDVRGREIPAAGTPTTRLLSPIQMSAERGGPLERRIVELGNEFGKLNRSITLQGHQIHLSDEDYELLQQLAGEEVDSYFQKFEERFERFDSLSEEQQQSFLRKAVSEGRERGRERFLREAFRSGRLRELVGETKAREERGRDAGNPYAIYVGDTP